MCQKVKFILNSFVIAIGVQPKNVSLDIGEIWENLKAES